MSVRERLAHSIGRKDQGPNHDLAQDIAASSDTEGLRALMALFEEHPDKRLLMDAALTIAYIGEINPRLVVAEVDFLIDKLKHKVNRVRWGSMIALAHIAHLIPEKMFENLPSILDSMDEGSVVGRDHGFKILVLLYQQDAYAEDLFVIILEQLSKAPPNQIGQYTERLMEVLRKEHKEQFTQVLEGIRGELENKYHLKRLDKNLKKLYK